MDEKDKRIKPNGLFSPPVVPAGYEADNYGLSNFYMPTLAEFEPSAVVPITRRDESQVPASDNNHPNYWPVAIISTLLLLLAGIVAAPFVSPAWSFLKGKFQTTQTVESQQVEETPAVSVLEQKTDSIVSPDTPPAPAKPAYHLIVASVTTQEQAQEELKRLQKTAFPEAQLITMKRGFGIAACKFDTKQDADDFLTVFKKERPQYADAWILFQ